MTRGVLYVIACGCSSAFLTEGLVRQAQTAGWDVCLIATPNGRKFLNLPQLAELTGHPVRSEYKQPDEPDLLPRADAIVVFPASLSTRDLPDPRLPKSASSSRHFYEPICISLLI